METVEGKFGSLEEGERVLGRTGNSDHGTPYTNRGTSLMENSTAPSGHHRALGIILQGPTEALFLISEVLMCSRRPCVSTPLAIFVHTTGSGRGGQRRIASQKCAAFP